MGSHIQSSPWLIPRSLLFSLSLTQRISTFLRVHVQDAQCSTGRRRSRTRSFWYARCSIMESSWSRTGVVLGLLIL